MYIRFAGALGTCITECDINAVKSFFLDYIQQSQGEISNQPQAIFHPWTASFGEMRGILETLETSVRTITNSARSVQGKISTLGAPACGSATGCAESTLNQFNDEGI